jgi:hypothetical protein
MRELSAHDCVQLRRELSVAVPLTDALPKNIGETQIGGGLWRFFSPRYPSGGVAKWNSDSGWKLEWQLHPMQFYAFGEDLFGNQLIVQPNIETVYLWNHENGNVADLLLDPPTLLETVVESGLNWIDFYNDGSLKLAEDRLMDVPGECHLHWTTPLILGGQVSTANTSVVERTMHLVGHAKLWKRISGCDPGTIIIPARKPKP